MKKLTFTIVINAPRSKVWDCLWQDANYRNWTSVFMEGSHAESDWKEGSDIKFLSPGGDGMFGIIKKMVEGEEMSFEHQGEIKGGQKITQVWGGAQERYFLKDNDGGTELTVLLDTHENWEKYFSETFPKALEKVRKLAES